MSVARTFLDWSQPALPQAADWLIRNNRMMNHVDLGETILVLPGKRAGRRLLEILLKRTDEHGWRFSSPRITTVGRLPELLYEPKRPFATELVQQLAWARALQHADRNELTSVIRNLPEGAGDSRWMDLARVIAKQHRELAADALHFGDVAEAGKAKTINESGRWSVLRSVQESYLRILDDLDLWDVQTARLFAIEHNEPRTTKSVVLIGMVDINRATRLMLEQVQDHVTALVHADGTLKRGFDLYGCLRPGFWSDRPIAIPDDRIRLADDPEDQAAFVATELDRFAGRLRADDVTIGVCDSQIVPQIQNRLAAFDVSARWLIGPPLTQTLPFRFLAALSDYLDDGRFGQFATLIRHPDVEAWLLSRDVPPTALAEVDSYFERHLPGRPGDWPGQMNPQSAIVRVHELIEQLSIVLRRGQQRPAEWGPLILHVLLELYGHIELDREAPDDATTMASLQALHQTLIDLTRIPESIAPQLSASEAIRLALEPPGDDPVIAEQDDRAVEMLGWLELPLDDAPALVVTTFNDGRVPHSLTSDLFLPNELRRKLGLVDNDRYYARDAYALSAILASREDVTLIVARRDAEDQPLLPSRLLFATGQEQIARRCLSFFSDEGQPDVLRIEPGVQSLPDKSGFVVPSAQPIEPVRELSVTAFRSYLQCPYRFYLRHILKLQRQDDEQMELDPLQFGSLAHRVLHLFGASSIVGSTDSSEIRRFLHDRLHRVARQQFGTQRMSAIDIQLLQLEARLSAFAEWQAEWANAGWRIRHVEIDEQQFGDVRFESGDGRYVLLRGRIDRIDWHEERQEWAIFDYKTSEQERRPERVHQKRTREGVEWVDLQLPLYRHLCRLLGIEDPRLGYIVLPRDRDRVDEHFAEWRQAELADADAVARQVVRNVLDGKFEQVSSDIPAMFDDYAAVCQSGVFERRLAGTP